MSDNTFSLNKTPSQFFDWPMLLLTLFVVAMGMLSIFSATYDSNMSSIFFKQLTAVMAGFAVMTVIIFIPEEWIQISSMPIYALSILLLLIVQFFGVEIYGTKGWLRIGGFSLQPSEIAKMGVMMMVAQHLSKKGTDIRTLRDLGIVMLYTMIPALLVKMQPDDGSVTVILAMVMGIMFWTGFEAFILYFFISLPIIILSSLKGLWYFAPITTALSAGAFMFRKRIYWPVIAIAFFVGIGFSAPKVYNNLAEHQKGRIETYLNPGSNPRGLGYNVMQSVMAVGSGGLSGKGYLQGTQTQLRYIPMQWTDFIFSVPAEEFGFIGAFLVILGLSGIIWKCVDTASMVTNKYASIVAIGAASLFFYHTVINIGMAIGVVPVMGIPLPFMSQGGTSIIVNLAIVGLVLNSNRHHKLKRMV